MAFLYPFGTHAYFSHSVLAMSTSGNKDKDCSHALLASRGTLKTKDRSKTDLKVRLKGCWVQ